ncbi:hypothetical protein EMIT07CA2_550058 [Brevibacillus sp. IT-7CA2]|uniref:hypothetical protein n=1 Tax=Brevibacillus sp. IT-7CA2 TaxID=3026436 RepID=UPI0039E1F612
MITQQMISKLREMNATQINLNLYFSLHIDWNRQVRGSIQEWAAAIKSDVRWVQKVIRKGIASGHFSRHAQDPDALIFNLTTSAVEFNKFTTKYCKHYKFLYCDAFRKLPVNAMRIVLIAAYEASIQSNNKNKPANTVRIHKDELLSLLPVDEVKFRHALTELSKADELPIHFEEIKQKDTKGKEHTFIEFTFTEDQIAQVLENHTEKSLLQWSIFEHQMDRAITDKHYEAILSVAKYLFNVLGPSYRDLARQIYQESLDVLLTQVRTMDKMEPDQLSAYYRGIVLNFLQEPLQHLMVETVTRLAERESIANTLIATHQQLSEKRVNVNSWIGYEPNLFNKTEITQLREQYAFLQECTKKWMKAKIQSEINKSSRQSDEHSSVATEIANDLVKSLKAKTDSVIDTRTVVSPRLLVRNIEHTIIKLQENYVVLLDQVIRDLSPAA